MNAIIFTGLQASGKSTYYKHNYVDTHVRINLDMLAASKSKERKLLEGCIDGKISCVVDNTNLTVAHRQVYIEKFKAAGYKIESHYFASTLEECLARNKLRDDKPPIPNVALYSGNKKLVVPTFDEGFDVISVITIDPGTGSFVERSI